MVRVFAVGKCVKGKIIFTKFLGEGMIKHA